MATSTSQSSRSMLTIQNCNADMTACTFAIRNEDHTLGNVLRHTLLQNEDTVDFAGYSVPHPSEPIVQIRVQTRCNVHSTKTAAVARNASTKTAPLALQEACDTVSQQCDYVLNQLEQLLPYVKEDRIRMEQYYIEQNEEEYEEDDNDAVQTVDNGNDNDDATMDMILDDCQTKKNL
jgi:DNA-directed RNA polymerases I and III subunit RPAC2